MEEDAEQRNQRGDAARQRPEQKADRRQNAGMHEGDAQHACLQMQGGHDDGGHAADRADPELLSARGLQKYRWGKHCCTNDQRHQNQSRDEEFIGHGQAAICGMDTFNYLTKLFN